MNVPPEVLEILSEWVRKAEHDVEAAKRIMAVEEGCPHDTVCFHCQQAVEKVQRARGGGWLRSVAVGRFGNSLEASKVAGLIRSDRARSNWLSTPQKARASVSW